MHFAGNLCLISKKIKKAEVLNGKTVKILKDLL